MARQENQKEKKEKKPRQKGVEIRPDLQDPLSGKDLSYLNELPQMGRYEGVKAGVPPPKEEDKKEKKKKKE